MYIFKWSSCNGINALIACSVQKQLETQRVDNNFNRTRIYLTIWANY